MIGLTGGIGSGKSTVTRLLAERGASVVDADVVAREVVASGTTGLAAVVAEFGERVLLDDGSLDRAALGALVFPDPARLRALSALVHPLVAARTAELFDSARRNGAHVLVHDVPLLVENGLAGAYDLVVVVDVPPELQRERLLEQRGMQPDDAEARIARQASREQRLAVADVVLDNAGTLEQLRAEVSELWRQIQARASSRKV